MSFAAMLFINYVESTSLRQLLLSLRYFVFTKTLLCNNQVREFDIYVVKLSKKRMKFRVWDNFLSIPLNMNAPVNKSNTNCLAILTLKYKPSVNIQTLQARAAFRPQACISRYKITKQYCINTHLCIVGDSNSANVTINIYPFMFW